MTGQVGVAIIGVGYWGMNYVRVFNEIPEARVAIVCDQRQERLNEVVQRFPNVPVTTSLEETLEMADVDVCVVCTGATSHYTVTRRCLEAGKPVLVEKPMTTHLRDAAALIDLAELKQLTLMVGHTFIYNPGIQKIKEYIQQDQIGSLYYIYARRTNLGPIRQDVNALWDLATHDVSIFNYLLNSTPLWVSAVGARVLQNTREDVGFVSLGYPNGIVGHIHVSWADPNKVREIVVVGSDKRLVFDDINTIERVRIFDKGVTPVRVEAPGFGEYQLQMRDGDIISPRIAINEPLKEECRHFLESVVHGTRPLTSCYEGREVVQVMEAIAESISKNGTPVQLDTLIQQHMNS